MNSDVCGNHGEGSGLLKSSLSVKLTVEELLVYYVNGEGGTKLLERRYLTFSLIIFLYITSLPIGKLERKSFEISVRRSWMYFCKTFLNNTYLISEAIVTLHDMEVNLVSSSQKKPSTLKLFELFESLRKRLSRNRSLRYK